MQFFAPQLHPDQHHSSLRASQHRKKRKTRHDGDRHDDDNDSSSDASDLDQTSPPSPSNPRSHPSSFASPELAQLRVAGLLPDHDPQLPPSPFPHAPATHSKPYLGTAKIQKELAAPPTRLFTINNAPSQPHHPSSHTEASNLRRNHLNVLSTLMHKCLLQGDYDRAGRAWGMILRTQATHGNTVDLRNHGRWAIGAEILLRRKPQVATANNQTLLDGESNSNDDDPFSEQGFELAREYYERLIVQHPTRKQNPHAVDQRSFYPAMFSLWIQEVCEKSRRARKQNAQETRSSRSRSMSIDSGEGNLADDARAREDVVQVEELARAMEIAERLDSLVNSPPFDKQASLLQLRGNIALWISDLVVGNTATTAMDEWDVYPISRNIAAAEQITKFSNCRRELHVAQNYLSRVEENGGPRQHQPLSKIQSRLKELQKQITKLELGEDDDDTNVSMEDAW